MEQQKIIKEIWLRDHFSVCVGPEPILKILGEELKSFRISGIQKIISCCNNKTIKCFSNYTFDSFDLYIDGSKIKSCIKEEILNPDFAIAGMDLIYENAPTEKYHLPFNLIDDYGDFNKVELLEESICIKVEVK